MLLEAKKVCALRNCFFTAEMDDMFVGELGEDDDGVGGGLNLSLKSASSPASLEKLLGAEKTLQSGGEHSKQQVRSNKEKCTSKTHAPAHNHRSTSLHTSAIFFQLQNAFGKCTASSGSR